MTAVVPDKNAFQETKRYKLPQQGKLRFLLKRVSQLSSETKGRRSVTYRKFTRSPLVKHFRKGKENEHNQKAIATRFQSLGGNSHLSSNYGYQVLRREQPCEQHSR